MSKRIIIFLAGAAAVLAAALPAHSASRQIESAKDKCLVGETAEGYLAVVDGASVDLELRRELRDINQQRKGYYADLAARNGVSVNVTATLAAEKLLNDARPGQCIRDQTGRWREV